MLGAEALLLSGNRVIAEWFTPIVWTGYVLSMDALVARLTGRSYLTTARGELVLVALCSIAGWWLFEWYNAPRFWRGGDDATGLWWQYHNLEPNLFLRRVGYDWAFATIFPALFLTAAALRATVFARCRVRPWTPPRWLLTTAVVIGVLAVAAPLIVVSRWLVPLVWLASRLLALLTSGFVCGVLWEFWNYWAATKWTYTVPYLGDVKVFEMPILGYLGFPPFALECYAMYQAVRGALA